MCEIQLQPIKYLVHTGGTILLIVCILLLEILVMIGVELKDVPTRPRRNHLRGYGVEYCLTFESIHLYVQTV